MLMSRILSALVAVFLFTMLPPLHAGERVISNSSLHSTFIELYSSEGCSSCPPAETWINALQDSPELWKSVFPVVFHVDYWNNLGWTDRFSNPVFTRRQRDYASRLGQSSVYTPEFIVNGREWRGWFKKESLPPVTTTGGTLALRVEEEGRKFSATFRPPSQGFAQDCTFHVALLGSQVATDVRAGENAGRTLLHNFVVLGFDTRPLTKSLGYQSGPIVLKPTTTARASGVVAWVSTGDGVILQVAGGSVSNPSAPHR